MSSSRFQRTLYTLCGVGAITASLFVAACGSSSSPGGSSTTGTALQCDTTEADLMPSVTTSATAPNDHATGSIVAAGSTALQPLMQAAATEYNATNPNAHITVNGGGSGTGLSSVASGSAQIGDSDIFVQDQSKTSPGNLVDHRVAVVVFTLAISNDIAGQIKNLTTDQINKIYDGTYTNWIQVGGPNEAINVVVRTQGSGTRATFDKYVMTPGYSTDQPPGAAVENATGDLITAMKNTPGSIGYTATGYTLTASNRGAITPICIDGHGAKAANVNSGVYKFWNYEHAYTNGQPSGLTASFLNYVNSSAFQSNDVLKLDFLRVSDLSAAATATHPLPAGAQ